MSRTSLIIAHSSTLETSLSAARIAGIPTDRIILLDRPHPHPSHARGIPCIRDLIQDSLAQEPLFLERTLDPGEGKTKVAILSWSSGTTGKPKVHSFIWTPTVIFMTDNEAFQAVAISHYAFIANIIQMAVQNKVGEAYSSRDSRGYRPGDVAIGGENSYPDVSH
jgi:4-coumarate--CoA ligase